MNEYFTVRESCPCCKSINSTTLYKVGYTKSPIKEYLDLFYSPQGGVEYEYLEDNFFSHLNSKTSFMVRMDNLSAAIVTPQVFTGSSNGFHWVYPASFIPSIRGGGMDRNQVVFSIGFGWRIASEYASIPDGDGQHDYLISKGIHGRRQKMQSDEIFFHGSYRRELRQEGLATDASLWVETKNRGLKIILKSS